MTTSAPVPGRSFIRCAPLLAQLGFKKSWLYKQIALGHFPPPIKVGRASVWDSAVVDAWMAERAAHQPLAV